MEVLRNLFGNLTSGIIRLLVAVGVLGAAYLFIVKPVLHTTDHAIDSANKSFEKSFGPHGSVNFDDISRAIETAKHHSSGNPRKLIKCIQNSRGDVNRIQRCTIRY